MNEILKYYDLDNKEDDVSFADIYFYIYYYNPNKKKEDKYTENTKRFKDKNELRKYKKNFRRKKTKLLLIKINF